MLRKFLRSILSRKTALFLILCVSLFFFSGTPLKAGKSLTLAEIDGKKITARDFSRYLNLFNGNPRYQARSLEEKKRLLNYLIDRILLLEAARKEGYANRNKIKKHPSLGKIEDETMILRAYLMDHVSHKVSVTSVEVKSYQKKHPDLSLKEAKDKLIGQRQKKIFFDLMKHLREGHTIRIYTNNLERYKKPGS